MGSISSLFVHKVVDVAAAADSADTALRSELLDSVGLDPQATVDPKVMVTDDDYYTLCERVFRDDPHGESLAVRVGSSMRCDDYGAFGLAWKTAPTLRDSFTRAERYGKVLTSVSTYELRSEDGVHFMMLHRAGDRRTGLQLSNEQTIVAVTQISREVSLENFVPVAVYFQHDCLVDSAALEEFFGCKVNYSSDRDALQVSEASLNSVNRLGDSSVANFFDTHLDKEIAELSEQNTLAERVRQEISQALSQGVPTISDIAVRLAMSGRTLQRRLAEDGHAYQALVDSARKGLAERLLHESEYSLAEIAFLTGFSDQSAFTRAFRRWAGQTPRSFRLAAGTRKG